MTDPDQSSLLGDIIAATSQPARPRQVREEPEDLLRLDDADWLKFLGGVNTDDLLILCSAASHAWRARVMDSLDDASRAWLQANLAMISDVTSAALSAAAERAMDPIRRQLRAGTMTLVPREGAMTAAPAPAREAPAPKPAPVPQRSPISVSFESPGAPPAAAAPRAEAPAKPPHPIIGSVSMSFGSPSDPVAPAPVAETAAVKHPGIPDGQLDGLFIDLLRLRRESGVAVLAQLAGEVPEPFLESGLRLVAADLPAVELERGLDLAIARQIEAHLDYLSGLRARLIGLADGH